MRIIAILSPTGKYGTKASEPNKYLCTIDWRGASNKAYRKTIQQNNVVNWGARLSREYGRRKRKYNVIIDLTYSYAISYMNIWKEDWGVIRPGNFGGSFNAKTIMKQSRYGLK